jgi:murein DD-endopeptidase MepM/ murein hydrolase activator NlpD
MRMPRRCGLLLLALALLVAHPALADSGYGKQKAALDAKLAAAQARIAKARVRERQLDSQIADLNGRIGSLESRVSDIAGTMSAIQTDLNLRRRRLAVLGRLYRAQTARVQQLRHIYRIAVARLDLELVTIYKSPQPGALELALQAKSFQDVLDELDYLSLFAKQDETVAQQVASAKRRVALARSDTAKVRHRVANETKLIDARLEQAEIIHAELLTRAQALSSRRAGKSMALLLARTQERAAIQESNATQAASAQVEAKIRAAETQPSSNQGASVATPSAAGLIWPVNGPITSPFGPRWGGFHPGIDIGVAAGTPIHAATAGTVIWCGWQSGYGNLVVIDAHNGIATAYAHQSRIAVSCNQDVTQGQVIGYVGCTGFCTGPHLHFEVRVNGTPVDPLGYLPS